MELFSEIYNCYYQIVDRILKEAEKNPVTEKEIRRICTDMGFAESSLYVLPKLVNGEWQLLSFDKTAGRSRTAAHGAMPFTLLQRSWIRTLMQDERFRLFFTDEELPVLERYVEDAGILWNAEDFRFYDRYDGGDDYPSFAYRQHFQTLLTAISRRQYVHISYQSMKGRRITHRYLPLKLEYSVKNDQFRLLAVPENERHSIYIRIINLCGITEVRLLPRYDQEDYDFEKVIRKSCYHEPVRLLIRNRRNALERAMLHFANYEKRTRKADTDTWECLIYYNSSMETELLIEILSFGPAIQVLGPESFLAQVKARMKRQMEQLSSAKSSPS